jgi:CMP-N-acetylneuraminic acid synthetase
METEYINFLISDKATLKSALIQMTAGHTGVMLVVNEQNRLLGLLSDGDVRRALLQDLSLNIPIEQVMNINPWCANTKEEGFAKLEERKDFLVAPVVSKDGYLLGICSSLVGRAGYFQLPQTEEAEQPIVEQRKNVVALIPARGGSKRIPKKNLSRLGKDSLVGLAIKAALASKYIDEVILSTDDEEIAEEGRKYGIIVSWLRPAELSSDTAKSIDVVLHAFKKVEEQWGYMPAIGLLLEPTAPLRTAEMLDEAIGHFNKHKTDSLVSVNAVRHIFHPEELLKSTPEGLLTPNMADRTFDTRKLRGQQEPLYVQNGLVYIFNIEMLFAQKSIYGASVLKFETDAALFTDIDEMEDLKLAQIKLGLI